MLALSTVILQAVCCKSLMILQMLLLLAPFNNSMWEASFENVSLRSFAKTYPFPSFSTTQLQPDVQGQEAREIN